MNKYLLTRLKRVEDCILPKKSPDLIWITFDNVNNVYRVEEDYYYEDRENKRKTIYFEHYKDYVFRSNYKCMVFLDLINAEEGCAFLFKCSDIRKKAKFPPNMAFSLDYDKGDSNVVKIESVFKLMERIDI